MPEPFKNLFNVKIIKGMGQHLKKAWPDFDDVGFVRDAKKNLDDLELKERSLQITNALETYLPKDFKKTAKIMLKSIAPELKNDYDEGIWDMRDDGIAGWALMPMTHYVGLHGQNHFDLSMTLLKEMTKRSSSEFDIRFFLISEPKRTLAVLETWAIDSNQHVRRLVSEGSRPRLPWAMRLPQFIKDPSPVIKLLEKLKDDESEYVRRSVANNLNDIAKDHPDTVASIAKKWLRGASKNRQRLVRHACRTLIKQGHKDTLEALGYSPPLVKSAKIKVKNKKVEFGSALEFEISFLSSSKKDQSLVIDYAIHHQKANGSLKAKIFKWKNLVLKPEQKLEAKKKHAMKKITTRVYYPGLHKLEVIINGVSIGTTPFQLVME